MNKGVFIDVLYYIDGKLYNKNEAGNYAWAYYLESKSVSGIISGVLAQGGSFIPRLFSNEAPRFDEDWDRRARWAGVEYFYARNHRWIAYYFIHYGRFKP